MVSTHTLLLFVAASIPLILVPGPAVAFILGTTLRSGRRPGMAATAGIELGYLVHVAGAVVGVSAVIASTALAFTAVKVAGACWLLWLAVQAWRRKGSSRDETLADVGRDEPAPGTAAGAFRRGLLVGALNPKTAVFYLAFLPQFVSPDAGPVAGQLLELGILFILLAASVDVQWAIAGGGLRRLVPRLRVAVVDRVSGVIYAALAAVTLTARRISSA